MIVPSLCTESLMPAFAETTQRKRNSEITMLKSEWKNYKLTTVLMIMAGTEDAGEGDR